MNSKKMFKESNIVRLKEGIRFILIGGIATGIHYSIYILLQLINVQYNIAYTLGYGISFIFNFFASNYFTFKTKPSTLRGIKFLGAHIFNYLLQIFLLNIFIRVNVSKSLAPILVYSVSVPTNFIIVRYALKGKNKNS